MKDEIDIFDKDGRFVYTIIASDEISNFIYFRFFKDNGAIIRNLEDRDIYVQYRIKNLPEIFAEK